MHDASSLESAKKFPSTESDAARKPPPFVAVLALTRLPAYRISCHAPRRNIDSALWLAVHSTHAGSRRTARRPIGLRRKRPFRGALMLTCMQIRSKRLNCGQQGVVHGEIEGHRSKGGTPARIFAFRSIHWHYIAGADDTVRIPCRQETRYLRHLAGHRRQQFELRSTAGDKPYTPRRNSRPGRGGG
jgi:hypothetical protein